MVPEYGGLLLIAFIILTVPLPLLLSWTNPILMRRCGSPAGINFITRYIAFKCRQVEPSSFLARTSPRSTQGDKIQHIEVAIFKRKCIYASSLRSTRPIAPFSELLSILCFVDATCSSCNFVFCMRNPPHVPSFLGIRVPGKSGDTLKTGLICETWNSTKQKTKVRN